MQQQEKMPADHRANIKEIHLRLIVLYGALDKSAQAGEWKQKLEAFEKATAAQKTSSHQR
jgi:DNA-binding ferritin-like protein (Dps family)